MTHLSDFSFLERANMFTYLWLFLLYHIWRSDRFACLAFSRVRNFELKTIVTILLLISTPFQLYYDFTSIKIKYSEGFYDLGSNDGGIISKPRELWTTADQDLVLPTDYSLMIGFSFQTGNLVLLQSFWNYLAGSVAKATFMGSLEFKLYIFWTCLTIVMFPILQFAFRSNDLLTEVVPELAYGISLFIIACLGVRSHFRFTRLIEATRDVINGETITAKLSYFLEMNKFMSLALFSEAISLIALCADALTPEKYLNSHKFTADLFIGNANLASLIIWFLVIMIIHPPANFSGVRDESPYLKNPNVSMAPVQRKTTLNNEVYIPYNSTISVDNPHKVQRDREPSHTRSPNNKSNTTVISYSSNKPIREENIDFYPVILANRPVSPTSPVSFQPYVNDQVPLNYEEIDEVDDGSQKYYNATKITPPVRPWSPQNKNMGQNDIYEAL